MKRFLSLIMSLILVMTLFVGCGEKESSYFKEMNELKNVKIGTGTMVLSFEGSGFSGVPAQLNDNGKTAVNLKLDLSSESDTKAAVKISAKFGSSDYADVTTIIFDENKMYVDAGSIIEIVRIFDEEAASQIEIMLASVGATKYVSFDIAQVFQAMNIEMTENAKIQEPMVEYVEDVIKRIEKSFDSLQGKDGDDYTLTINGDNADEFVDGMNTFCKNDLKEVYTKFIDTMKTVADNGGEMYQQFNNIEDDTSDIDELAKGLSDEEKEEFVKAIKDSKMNMVSRINISGKEGSRVAKFSIDTGELSESGMKETFRMDFTGEFKEGNVSIADMIPTDAMDLTSMLVGAYNMQQGSLQ